jgi:hypothetical protein
MMNPERQGDGMEPIKSGFGVMRALMPVLYCGGLYYYLSSGTFGPEGTTPGMSPNMLVIICAGGLLFSIPLILKLVRIFARAHSPGRDIAHTSDDDAGGFDPDAAIARYMASRSVDAAPDAPAARPAHTGGGPARRAGFGRRAT